MRLLIYIFVFFCFFPYINIINIGTDTQPNALVAAAVLLFSISNKKLNTPIILLWLLFLMSLVLALFSQLDAFDTVKNILNYLSTPMICLAAYNVFIKSDFKLPYRVFLLIVSTYFAVAAVQMYIDPGFMTALLNQGARGVMLGGRGVVSLCPEPAFYGSLCLFFMVFSLIMYSPKQNILTIGLLAVQLILFAQSATSILVFLVACCVFLFIQLLKFRLNYILYTSVIVIMCIFSWARWQDELSQSRAGILIQEIAENPLLLAQADVSAGVRITSTVSPFLAAKHYWGLPMGWGTYKAFVRELNQSGDYPKLLNPYIVNEIGRLGGGINMILFQLGILGILFPLAIWLAFKKILTRRAVLFAFVLFILVLFTQIQLMQSMIGFIIASAIYLSRDTINEKYKLA